MYMFARIRDTDVHLKGIIVEWLTANQSARRVKCQMRHVVIVLEWSRYYTRDVDKNRRAHLGPISLLFAGNCNVSAIPNSGLCV